MVKPGDTLVKVVHGAVWGEPVELELVVPQTTDLAYWNFLVSFCRWRVRG